MKTQLPFMSVVLCTYNGAKTIVVALDSLVQQDYPKDRYEIIVVDDGSSDDIGSLVASYPVRYFRHPKNKGISAARNTGLKHVRGEVYVNFDDDCWASPNWLSELAKGYNLPGVAGIAGKITFLTSRQSIVDKFMIETGCGNPAPYRLDAAQGIWQRFLSYVKVRLETSSLSSNEVVKVRELNGANASFPVSVLRAVKGWDVRMSGVEDSDISRRILNHFDRLGLAFYALPRAQIAHDPHMTFRQYIERPLKRGPVNLQYYSSHNLIPPFFPFPFLWLAGSLALLHFGPIATLASLIVLPQLLYLWWPIRMLREKKPWFALFAYIQLLEESAMIIGLLRGYRRREVRSA